jgi:hypothetical protein
VNRRTRRAFRRLASAVLLAMLAAALVAALQSPAPAHDRHAPARTTEKAS